MDHLNVQMDIVKEHDAGEYVPHAEEPRFCETLPMPWIGELNEYIRLMEQTFRMVHEHQEDNDFVGMVRHLFPEYQWTSMEAFSLYINRLRSFLMGLREICLGENCDMTSIRNYENHWTEIDRCNETLQLSPFEPLFVHPLGIRERFGDSGEWAVYREENLTFFVQNLFRFFHLDPEPTLTQYAHYFLQALITPLENEQDEEEEEEEMGEEDDDMNVDQGGEEEEGEL
jgi:hypothetical protein